MKQIRKKSRQEGNIYAIPLSEGEFGYGQVAYGGDMAFFDLKSREIFEPEEIVRHRIAFRVPVAPDAVTAGKWKLLGTLPPQGNLGQHASYRHRPVGSEQVFRYQEGVSSPATEKEVEGLEDLSTWFSFHVQERLEDHFADRPNKYVAMLANRKR